METIIVSRHPAAIEFIARELGAMGGYATEAGPATHIRIHADDVYPECGSGDCCYSEPHFTIIPVLAVATADDVRGKHVYGNLPLHLAALAAQVTVVEFEGAPPRGTEYTLADMDAAGAVLRSYVVSRPPYVGGGRGLRDRAEEMRAADTVSEAPVSLTERYASPPSLDEHYRTQQDRAQDAHWEDMRNASSPSGGDAMDPGAPAVRLALAKRVLERLETYLYLSPRDRELSEMVGALDAALNA